MRTMPTLHGARVHIRPFTGSDIDAVLGLFDDAAYPTAVNQTIRTRRSAWLAWASANHDELARLDQPPYGDRAVVLTATDRVIGAVGLVPCLDVYGQAGIGPDDGRSRAEIGLFWMVHPDYQGKGYATEAGRLLVRYAMDELRIERIIATTEYDNHASQAVMRKLGMDIRRNSQTTPPWLQLVGVYESWMEPERFSDGTFVRPIVESDFDELLALWRGAPLRISPTDTPTGLRRHIALSGRFALALCSADGVIIGTVLGSDDGRRGWVNHLAVRQDQQHQGNGKRLVRILAERLTAAGCEKLNLLVVNNNAHVVPFYESLGFCIDDNLFMARWLREL
jgi:RimJ/RimL family protein N-acetyltransferase